MLIRIVDSIDIYTYLCRILVLRGKFMKRSKDDIIAQILSVCSEGAGKTKIVYQANLNYFHLCLVWSAITQPFINIFILSPSCSEVPFKFLKYTQYLRSIPSLFRCYNPMFSEIVGPRA